MPQYPQHPIRSFVRRQGRMTQGQQRALARYWPRYGLNPEGPQLDLHGVFRRSARCILEIGFGDGEGLLSLAAAHPEQDYLGVEIHQPGVGHLLLRAVELNLTNLRIFHADAVAVLQHRIPDASLDGVNIFFPDPWPKKRHYKRRLLQQAFVMLLAQKMHRGGILHLATDWRDYARQMLRVMTATEAFQNTTDGFASRPIERPLTKFERRGQKLGHPVWDLIFQRCEGSVRTCIV